MANVGPCPPGLQKLAIAVLKQAFSDVRSEQATTRDQARVWLLGHSQPLQLWSALAGVSLDQVRRAVTRALTEPSRPTDVDPSDDETEAA
jgi:hypothetical protein